MAAPAKKPLSAYLLFSQASRAQVQAENPGLKLGGVAKKLGERWRTLDPETKAKFQSQAAAQKASYQEYLNRTNANELNEPKDDRPDLPKKPLAAYFHFSQLKREEVAAQNPGLRVSDVAKKLGALWRAMSEDEKAPYVKRASEDKDRYIKEMAEAKAAGIVFASKAVSAAPASSALGHAVALPQARVLRIIKRDPSVRQVSKEAGYLVAKACEIFVRSLATDSQGVASLHRRRTLKPQDLHRVIHAPTAQEGGGGERLQFLAHDFPKDFPPLPKRRASAGRKLQSSSGSGSAPATQSITSFFQPKQATAVAAGNDPASVAAAAVASVDADEDTEDLLMMAMEDPEGEEEGEEEAGGEHYAEEEQEYEA